MQTFKDVRAWPIRGNRDRFRIAVHDHDGAFLFFVDVPGRENANEVLRLLNGRER